LTRYWIDRAGSFHDRGMGPRVAFVLALVLVLGGARDDRAVAQALADEVGEDCTLALGPAHGEGSTSARPPVAAPREELPRPRTSDAVVLAGRALGALSFERCASLLDEARVPFERAEASAGVAQPVRVRGPIGGVVVRTQGAEPRAVRGHVEVDHRFDAVLDCRLVVALHAWSRELREAGFVGLEHVSVFRPRARVAATGRVSGHAHALAIDVLRLVRPDGSTFSILDDWTARAHGADPCGAFDEPEEQRRVRRAVCSGVERGLFQVVITPHHDHRHANHLHLEVRPDVDWSVVR
jgi:hypothetical protein